jgi:hypothetical protein
MICAEFVILKNKTHVGQLAAHACRIKTKIKEVTKPLYVVHSHHRSNALINVTG